MAHVLRNVNFNYGRLAFRYNSNLPFVRENVKRNMLEILRNPPTCSGCDKCSTKNKLLYIEEHDDGITGVIADPFLKDDEVSDVVDEVLTSDKVDTCLCKRVSQLKIDN